MSNHKLVVAAALAAAATFPTVVRLWNNTWREAVEPETLTVVPPYGHVDVTFTSADQLIRAESNVETHNLVNQWPEPAGLFLCEAAEAAESEQATEPSPGPLTFQAAPGAAPAPAPATAAPEAASAPAPAPAAQESAATQQPESKPVDTKAAAKSGKK